jgi:glycerate kinase
MADGGEGTVEALVAATGGQVVLAQAADPLGRPIRAAFGLCAGGSLAVIEMAAASGLALLKPGERDPLRASTRGTGMLMRAALDAGARRILVGIGGSATVDGGTGMAAALGARFLGPDGRHIPDPGGGRLQDIRSVDLSGLDPRLKSAELTVACDVTNPLVGPEGAARVYGPQKGARPAEVERLEAGLQNLALVIERDLGLDVRAGPGGGAAGGLGAGLAAFLGARLASGVQTVMEAARLQQRLAGSDLVLTGEGRADAQSACGKVPAGVAGLARQHGVPVVVLAGSIGPGYERLYDLGVAAVLSISDGPMALQTAFERTEALLEMAAASVLRLWLAARQVRTPHG